MVSRLHIWIIGVYYSYVSSLKLRSNLLQTAIETKVKWFFILLKDLTFVWMMYEEKADCQYVRAYFVFKFFSF